MVTISACAGVQIAEIDKQSASAFAKHEIMVPPMKYQPISLLAQGLNQWDAPCKPGVGQKMGDIPPVEDDRPAFQLSNFWQIMTWGETHEHAGIYLAGAFLPLGARADIGDLFDLAVARRLRIGKQKDRPKAVCP
jgi:hypothetical protein